MRISARVLAAVFCLGAYITASPAHAADVTGTCAQALKHVEAGDLTDAASVASAVGQPCQTRVARLIAEATRAAQNLADQAKSAVASEDKEHLATLALTLDDANKDAKGVLKSLKPEQDLDACTAAESAVAQGELARAQALYDALKDDDAAKSCRVSGESLLAKAREARGPTRIQHFVLDDGRTTWLIALVAFMIGVVCAGTLRFTIKVATAAVLTSAVAVCIVVWQSLQPSPWWSASTADSSGEHPDLNLWIYVVLVAAFSGAGLVLSNAMRTRAPVRVTMSGDEQNGLAPRVLAELHALGDSGAKGVYAPSDTDVSASGVAGALDTATNPIVKTLLTVWRTIQLQTADRAEVAVVANDKAPISATIMLYQGSKLVETKAVEGSQFCVDGAQPTEAELAASERDVATGVASVILLWRLVKLGATPGKDAAKATARLYGATDPIGVAMAAVAARRLGHGDAAAAGLLYARAVDLDPANRSARFGRITAALRAYPGGRTAQRLIAELSELHDAEEKDSPLKWRMTYNLAAAIANSVLVGEKPEHQLLGRPHVVAAFKQARKLLDNSPPEFAVGDVVVETDHELWRKVRQMSEVASLGLRPDDIAKPVKDRSSELLIRMPLTVAPALLHNVACGLALAYAGTSPNNRDRRRRLAETCVDRLRLSGVSPDRRAALLADPFLGFVAGTKPFAALKEEWGFVRDDPYSDIDSIGEQSEKLAESYPRPRDLAMALSTLAGRNTVVETYGVDATTARRWAGAAAWLAAAQPTSRINLYQASGYPDASAAAADDDSLVQSHLKSTARVTGATEMPTAAERAAMALAQP